MVSAKQARDAMHSKSCNAGDGLECAICWEPFNADKHCPYALWCGHTLCKTCINGLPWANFQQIPQFTFHLPCIISCPWCSWLTPRVTVQKTLKYPCKNFSLVWLLEAVKQQELAGGGQSPSERPSPISRTAPGTGLSLNNRFNDSSSFVHPLARGGPEVRPAPGGEGDPDTVVGGLEALIFWSISVMLGIASFCFRLVRKLPLVLMLLAIIFGVLPCSGFITIVHFFLSLFFAIPSSAITFMSLYYVELLVLRIMD